MSIRTRIAPSLPIQQARHKPQLWKYHFLFCLEILYSVLSIQHTLSLYWTFFQLHRMKDYKLCFLCIKTPLPSHCVLSSTPERHYSENIYLPLRISEVSPSTSLLIFRAAWSAFLNSPLPTLSVFLKMDF